MLTASGLMPMPAHLAPENGCRTEKVVKPSFMRGFKSGVHIRRTF